MIQQKPVPHGMDGEKAELIRSLAKRDLKFLCGQFLYKEKLIWDAVHDDVEVMLKKQSQRKCIVLPRDHSKSSFVTIAWSIQQILRNPNVRILIANGVWDQARKFLLEIKGYLESSDLKYFFGDFVSSRWNSDDIIVRQRTKPFKEPTIMTTGVEAESTGARADIIIADDLMGSQNFDSPEKREKVKRFRRSLQHLLEPGGIFVDIMTRWHLDDTYAEIMEKENRFYDVMVRKIVEDGKLIYPQKFSKRFDPVHKEFVPAPGHCMDYVDYLKGKFPPDEWSSQYLNEPISTENQVFKPEMFKHWNERPDGLYIAMGVDLAISQVAGSDWTALVVMGMDAKRRLYVLDYMRGKWGPSDTVKNIFDMQERWRPVVVGMETNGFQRTYKLAVEAEMRARNRYFAVAEIRNGPDKSKEWRIKKMEPFYRGGLVSHAAWMKGKDFEMELLTFPKGRNDDMIDAAAMTLDLLAPGDEGRPAEAPPGSWDAIVAETHRNRGTGKGYFKVFW